MGHDFNRLTSRRSFLTGSAIVAMSTAFAVRTGFASQEPGQSAAPPATTAPNDASPDTSLPDQSNDAKGDADHTTEGQKPQSTLTLKDDQGIEYRECPQCGFNMYRQDRTWTCENCGYSYTE